VFWDKSGGRLFQVIGPLMVKLRCPVVEPAEFQSLQITDAVQLRWPWKINNQSRLTSRTFRLLSSAYFLVFSIYVRF